MYYVYACSYAATQGKPFIIILHPFNIIQPVGDHVFCLRQINFSGCPKQA